MATSSFKATDKWEFPQLIVPGVGTMVKEDTMELDPEEFGTVWLLQQGYIEKGKGDSSTEPGKKADPVPVEIKPQPTPGGSSQGELSEDGILIDFLNTNDAAKIQETIKGIGSTTAQAIVAGRPMDMDKLTSMLQQRQLDAAMEWAKAERDLRYDPAKNS